MAELTFTPVDHDPFAAPAQNGRQLTPVDNDPFAKPSVAEDVARQAPGSLYKGAMDVIGAPADIVNLADSAWQWLVSKGLEKTGVWTPEQAEKARQPIAGLEDRSTRGGFPTSQLLTDATEKAAGPFYQPQTTEGQWAATATRALPGMVAAPGSVVQRGVQTVLPALASEGAGRIAHEYAPDYETGARILGGVATGATVAAAQAPRGANVVMQDALRGVSDQELTAAYALIDRAAQLPGGGVTLTLNDALGQVTNGRTTRLQQLDGTVTNSGGPGAERMAQVYSARPGEIQRTGEAAVESIAPNPYEAGQAAQRGQTAAENALTTVRGERSASTGPFYEAARGDTVPAQNVQGVIQRLDQMIAEAPTPELAEAARQLRGQLIETPAVPGTPATRTPVTDPRTGQIIRYDSTPATPGSPEVPRTNAADLDKVYGQARDDFGGPPVLGETGSEARARRAAGEAIQPLNQAILDNSPNIQQGRAVHQDMTQNVVAPMEQGPLGRVASIDPATERASAAMGRQMAAPDADRYHGVVQQSVRRMVRQDPRAAETLARDYAGDVLNKALTPNQGGPNAYSGANFFKQIAGDPASMRNLEAMITQLPDGHNRWGGFQTFLETMQATRYKAAKGSDTAFKLGIKEELSRPGIAGTVAQGAGGAIAGTAVGGAGGSVAGTAAGLKKALDARLDSWRLSNGGDQVAWMMTSPEARPLLRQLSNVPPGSAQAIGLSLRLSYIAERALNEGQQGEAAPIVQSR